MPFLTGCVAELAAVAQAGISGLDVYLENKRNPIVVKTAECGNIDLAFLDEGFETRWTQHEQDRIVEEQVKLDKLCGL